MAAMIEGPRVGVYCSSRLGDNPDQSRSGCRFYVYVGRACEAWLDYHDLDAAVAENPGQPVFDRASMKDILLEELQRLNGRPGVGSANGDFPFHLFKMLRDVEVRDQTVLWHAAQAVWHANQSEPEAA